METIDDMAPVMGADGQFHAQDEAVDLSDTKLEAWVALGFFWILGATVFYQFFTRYVLNDSAAWTEEIARYLLIAVVFTGATIGVVKNKIMYGKKVKGIERSTFLVGADGMLKEEWRGLKVPGHVDDVLKAVKALKKAA